MIEWSGFKDKKTGLPVYSLYGKHRKPTKEMLKGLDVLVLDLFDVGARYYTYIWTLMLCMEACEEEGKTIVVLDRPNPIDGMTVEGPVLEQNYASFVGLKPLAIRHGLTMGEIAVMFKQQYYHKCKLEIIKMKGWKRTEYYDTTGLPWAVPSPNMPTLETAVVYPGMCLFEGVNLSEGRGTTRPFELFGAPWLDADKLVKVLRSYKLPGVVFRPYHFMPTFDKHKGEICHGTFMHITDRRIFKPFLTAVGAIKACREQNISKFKWLDGPYEYETVKLPIDILFGNGRIRKQIESGSALTIIERGYKSEQQIFEKERKEWLLY
ncbi:MAG: DUF1343 domain-containing protein, partial [Fibrobacteres bacterium]|nr:DUF1343 domain-containing protein [Fibrobacterota bacterium]